VSLLDFRLTIIIGAADANYAIERSRLPATHSDCVLEKVTISVGQYITGQAEFAIGVKDDPIRVARYGYVNKLQWISQKFVVMWDEADKRGWLVNGTSALLHLTRASLEYNKQDKFKSAFLFKSEKMNEASALHTADSAIDVLLDDSNVDLEIYQDRNQIYSEKTTTKGESNEVSKMTTNYIRFGDRVEEYYNILEKIIDHQVQVAGHNGIKMKLRSRKYLEGWDFKDLATNRDPFHPSVATLPTIGKGWVDFTRSIHAITLFGRGFGEIFQPRLSSGPCLQWSKLPKDKFYLAVSNSDLKDIMELHGDPDTNPIKLSGDIVLHFPGLAYGPCRCRDKAKGGHSEFVQVPLPSRTGQRIRATNVHPLEPCGALILGHHRAFNFYYKDTGDPEIGKADTFSKDSEAQSSKSSILSSLRTSILSRGKHSRSPTTGTSISSSVLNENLASSVESSSEPLTNPTTQGSTSSGQNAPSNTEADERVRPKGGQKSIGKRVLSRMFRN